MKKVLMHVTVVVCMIALLCCSAYALPASTDRIYSGIDVSVWQGEINFEAVRQDGIEIVYIRSSSGSGFVDPNFEQNYERAKAAGLSVGFYHYVTARSESQARYQAEFFASLVHGKDYDCRLAMDFEDLRGLSRSEINAIASAFLETLEEKTESELVIYSDAYNAENAFDKSLTRYPLWIAQYGVTQPSDRTQWSEWIGWQYTSSGRISGISGNVDRDRFTEDILLTSKPDPNRPKPEPSIPGNSTISYTVKRGDTLYAIAELYHTSVSALVQENDIANPNLIYPGQVLNITIHDDVTRICEYYTVQRGDTLYAIALRYNTTVSALANRNGITNPNLIYPGQRLCVNSRQDGSPPPAPTVTYTVRRGDTLYTIARRYDTTVSALVRENSIANPNLIYPGEVLRIP